MNHARTLLPHPLLSVLVAIVWVFLVNEVSLGHVLLGASLGIVIPLMTAPYWPDRPRIGRPILILEYLLIVLFDIVVANFEVARLVLFRRGDALGSRFVTVPLDLSGAEAIAILAATITMTPGTVSADLSADGRSLLVHCLETADPDETVRAIKTRYENRLKEIFR